ncbi:aminotransferase class V-fold PLP-dependent enzyme [Terrihabitans sp. B22-R8]|uniref:aminotransferase class V-fold PLP-dependent enzyme n=1 Tax=Terrihabitans sp. B22-R8 TaxID=3425128 RepID=UPI00403D2251
MHQHTSPSLDIAALRAQTLGTANAVYLNNASSSLMPRNVVDAITDHARSEAELGVQRAAARVEDRLAAGIKDAATLFGCAPADVVFTTSNTQGWHSALAAIRLGPGDVILTGNSEWGGNYAALLHLAARTGSHVETIPNDPQGTVSLEALAARMDERVKLIAITWVASGNGAVQPAAGIGRIAREAGIPFLLDGAQGVGQLPAEVADLGCDVLTVPGRKWLRGPQGSGLLYVRASFADRHPPLLVDYFSARLAEKGPVPREGAAGFERAGLSTAVRLGLCTALREHVSAGPACIHERIQTLGKRLRMGLGALPNISVRDTGIQQAGLVTFTHAARPSIEVCEALARQGIVVTTIGAFYTPVDFAARGLSEVVRVSPHVFNTEDEIDRLLEAVSRC